LLSREQAYAFVTSWAVALMTLSEFRDLNVPLVSHKVTVEREDGTDAGGPFWYLKLGLSPPDVTHNLTFRPLDNRTVEFAASGLGGDVVKNRWVKVGSVLDELNVVGSYLAQFYPLHPSEATWFVLTGKSPWVEPIPVRVRAYESEAFDHTSITLTVAPWISADLVREVYRSEQKELLGKRNVALGRRNIALFRFALNQGKIGPPHGDTKRARRRGPTWSTLRDSWNEMHPQGDDWHYEKEDIGNFAGTIRDIQKAIVHPKYNHS